VAEEQVGSMGSRLGLIGWWDAHRGGLAMVRSLAVEEEVDGSMDQRSSAR
jgi:hypothetical protein